MERGISNTNGKGLGDDLRRLRARQPQQENVFDLKSWRQRSPAISVVRKSYEEQVSGRFSVQRPASAYPQGRLTGQVQFLSKLISLWNLDRNAACALLGYEESDQDYVTAILSGATSFRGRDARDRVTNLFKIRSVLSSIFRNLEVENEWLREPQKVFDERTPLDLLLEGSMENLLRVRLLVERMGGLLP